MRVEPYIPDAAPAPKPAGNGGGDFASLLDGAGSLFATAERAEDAFAAGSGTLQDAVYERARADVALSVAAAAAQRGASALQTILSMQV